jgi:hypothetical protein
MADAQLPELLTCLARTDVIADRIKAPVAGAAATGPSRHRNGFQRHAKGFW